MPKLTLHSYCGMAFPLYEGDVHDCRIKAYECIRNHRRSGRDVSVLKSGRRWEMLEAEDAAMVYDDTGIMALTGEDDVESSY